MPVRTVLNAQFITDVVWQIRLSLNELNDLAGLSRSYLYRLTDEERRAGLTLDTIDRLHNAIEARMLEVGISPPDDLWHKLVLQIPVVPALPED